MANRQWSLVYFIFLELAIPARYAWIGSWGVFWHFDS
jgi:hypothetical protein